MTSPDPQEPLRRRRHAQAAQDSSGWSEDADSSWADYRDERSRPRPRRAREEVPEGAAVPAAPQGLGGRLPESGQPGPTEHRSAPGRRSGQRRPAEESPAGPATGHGGWGVPTAPSASAPAEAAATAGAAPAAAQAAAPATHAVPAAPQPAPPQAAAPQASPQAAPAAGPLPWWARTGSPQTQPSAPDRGGLFQARTPAAAGEPDQVVPMVAAWPPTAPAAAPPPAAPPRVDPPPAATPRPSSTAPATPPAGWSPSPLPFEHAPPAAVPVRPSASDEVPAWPSSAPPAPLPPVVVPAATTSEVPAVASSPAPVEPEAFPFPSPSRRASFVAPLPTPEPPVVPPTSRVDAEVTGPDQAVDQPPRRAGRPRSRDAGPTTTIPVLRPGVPTTSGPIPLVVGAAALPEAPDVSTSSALDPVSAPTPVAEPAPRSRREAKLGRTGEQPVVSDASATPPGGLPAVAAAPAPRAGRAGRNLPLATAVGVVLAVAVVASLFARKEAFVGVAALAVVLGLWELGQALRTGKIQIPVVPLSVGAVGMLVSAFVAGPQGLLVAFALTTFGVVMWRILDGLDGAVRDVAAGIFAAAYLPLLAGFAVLMLAADDGPLRVVTFIAVTVASDIGGYAAGVLFGRRPMAPSVSPKKSWEGFAGSLLTCVGVGVGTVMGVLGGPWWAGALVGLAAVVTATVGDLSESLLKRDLGIKDMSSILPGHGGIMDRLDSLLLTAPVVYLLLAWWVPVG